MAFLLKNKTLLLAAVIFHRRRKRRKKNRKIYIRDIFKKRRESGESVLVKELKEDPYYHFRYFRMNKSSFLEILELITEDITKSKTHLLPISPMEKVGLTLRFLASGNSQISLGLSYRISPQAVGHIIRDVLTAICTHLGPIYLPTPTTDIWKKNEKLFHELWNFPNACGALDGKHIRIRCPNLTGSTHFNYKQYFSIVLLAIVGGDYKFTAVDIGASGSQSDGGIFTRSLLGKKLENQELSLPEPKYIESRYLPHVILSDDAFSLKPNLLKPYPGKFLTKEKRIFNYRLSRARMVVENSFGILAARWRIFHTPITGNLDLVKLIVQASIILHNFLICKKDWNTICGDTIGGFEKSGNWRNSTANDNCVNQLQQQGSNNYPASAASVRDSFKTYFNEEGAVSWQEFNI